MIDILKITLTLTLVLFLIRKKHKIGYILLGASLFLSLLYRLSPTLFIKSIISATGSKLTLDLLLALSFIRMFEKILRENNVISQMMASVKKTLKNKKAVMISMPLIIGMMPSVGGAYFSAPMVDEASKGLNLSPEEKSFTNYWYRHPWEFILPLYPGLILASAIGHVELRTLVAYNCAYALIMLLVGLFFGVKNVFGKFESTEHISFLSALNFIPIIVLLILVMGINIQLHYALIGVVLIFMIIFRYNLSSIFQTIRYGISKEIIVLILGVVLFKEILQSSSAVYNIALFLTNQKIPLLPILFLLPFVCGLLTGITIGFVGITFPLLVSLEGIDASALSFAFAAGFCGVLMSPVHVCLILTKEYFKGHMLKIYKRIIPSVGIIMIVALIEYIILLHHFTF